jgi:hypothetical protein
MPSQRRIEVRENFPDIPVQMGDAVEGLEAGIAFGPEDFFTVPA